MTALTIAIRELRDRSRLFLICIALAAVPFLAAALPGARADRTGVIAAVSGFLSLALALGSSVAFGASTVARDLVERRLSFYFSKPVPPAAIWIGKAAAALIASFTCFAIIAAPAALVAGSAWPNLWTMRSSQLLGIVVGGVIVLFFVSHLLATMIRSRSPLIAVDFVLLLLFVGTALLVMRPLLLGAAVTLGGAVGSAIAFGMLIAAALAPIGQLARGRTDIRRSHAALSRYLWPPLFAALVLVAGYVWWVVSAGPEDVASVLYLDQAPRGERVFAFGSTRGRGDYHAAFTVDGQGNWKRLPAAPWSRVAFSRDGKTMAWLEAADFIPKVEVQIRTDRGPTNIRTRSFAEMVLSDDGSRIAVADGRLVSVYELASGRLLAAAAGFDGARGHTMFFVTNDLLRVLESNYRGAAPVKIFELDIARKKLAVTGQINLTHGDSGIASPDGSRLLLRKSRRVIDGRTAATLAELPPSEKSATAVLDDGRVIEIVLGEKDALLRVIGGAEVRLPAGIAMVAGQLADGTLIVIGSKGPGWSATGSERMVFLVDVNRGAVVRTIPNVKAAQSHWWAADPRLVRFEGPRMAGVDAAGKLVWWDAKTGRTERPPRLGD